MVWIRVRFWIRFRVKVFHFIQRSEYKSPDPFSSLHPEHRHGIRAVRRVWCSLKPESTISGDQR